MFFFRRKRGQAPWHFCQNCSHWPESDYETYEGTPEHGEVCWECHGRDRNGDCRYETPEDRQARE